MTEPLRMSDRQMAPPAKHMRWIPGSTFRMGSENFYVEERPVHDVAVDGFWIDEHGDGRGVPAVREGHGIRDRGRATARRCAVPEADPALLIPGALVFQKATAPVDAARLPQLVGVRAGASWTHPEGPDSTTDGIGTR